jgi:hypothetical protein
LIVNGQSYGRIGETDAVLVDHGKVSVNPARRYFQSTVSESGNTGADR